MSFGNIHQGASLPASQAVAFGNQTVTNAAYQDLLDVSATTGNTLVTATGFTGLGASTGGTATNSLTFAVPNTAAAGSLAGTAAVTLNSNHNNVTGLSDLTLSPSGGAIVTSGQIYSGLMTWNGGTGNWNANANWTDTTNAAVHAPPGLDAGFTNVDTATFAENGSGGTVSLNGYSPSLAAITFSNSGRAGYTLAQGSAGTLLLNGGGSAASIYAAGTHTIAAPVNLATYAGVTTAAATDSFTISGPISGAGGLSLNGPGAVTLSGANTYSGTTTVNNILPDNGGANYNVTLNLYGSLSNSPMAIQSGVLAMAGTIGQNVTMSGGGIDDRPDAVAPLISGNLTVTGGTANWYSALTTVAGGVTVQNGLFLLGNGAKLNTPTVTINGGALSTLGSNVLSSASAVSRQRRHTGRLWQRAEHPIPQHG